MFTVWYRLTTEEWWLVMHTPSLLRVLHHLAKWAGGSDWAVTDKQPSDTELTERKTRTPEMFKEGCTVWGGISYELANQPFGCCTDLGDVKAFFRSVDELEIHISKNYERIVGRKDVVYTIQPQKHDKYNLNWGWLSNELLLHCDNLSDARKFMRIIAAEMS